MTCGALEVAASIAVVVAGYGVAALALSEVVRRFWRAVPWTDWF